MYLNNKLNEGLEENSKFVEISARDLIPGDMVVKLDIHGEPYRKYRVTKISKQEPSKNPIVKNKYDLYIYKNKIGGSTPGVYEIDSEDYDVWGMKFDDKVIILRREPAVKESLKKNPMRNKNLTEDIPDAPWVKYASEISAYGSYNPEDWVDEEPEKELRTKWKATLRKEDGSTYEVEEIYPSEYTEEEVKEEIWENSGEGEEVIDLEAIEEIEWEIDENFKWVKNVMDNRTPTFITKSEDNLKQLKEENEEDVSKTMFEDLDDEDPEIKLEDNFTEDFYINSKWDDLDDDETRYEYIKSKSVLDSDGFYTDYTMYKDNITDNFVFVFGDNDVYTPENEDFDYVAETEKEANEWFDNYNGFDEDMDEAFNEFANLDKKKEALEVEFNDDFDEKNENWVASSTANFNSGYAAGRNDKDKNQIKTEEDIRIELKDAPMDSNEIAMYIAGYRKGIKENYDYNFDELNDEDLDESLNESTQISWIKAEDLPIGKKIHYEGKEYEIINVQDVDEINPDQVFIILKDKNGKERKITEVRNRAFTSVHDDWDYGEWESFENILNAANEYIENHPEDNYMELNFIYNELGQDYYEKLSNEEKKQLSKLLRKPIINEYHQIDMTDEWGGTRSCIVKAQTDKEARKKAEKAHPNWKYRATYVASEADVDWAKRHKLYVENIDEAFEPVQLKDEKGNIIVDLSGEDGFVGTDLEETKNESADDEDLRNWKIEDIEFIMKDLAQSSMGIKSVEGSGTKYKVTTDDFGTAEVEFDPEWDEWVYTINGKGPFSHSSYEYIASDIDKVLRTTANESINEDLPYYLDPSHLMELKKAVDDELSDMNFKFNNDKYELELLDKVADNVMFNHDLYDYPELITNMVEKKYKYYANLKKNESLAEDPSDSWEEGKEGWDEESIFTKLKRKYGKKDLKESAMSDLDTEIRDSEGIDKLIYKTEKNVRALEDEEKFLINQAPREIKKGGAFDSQEEIDEALEETRKELSKERAKLRMLRGVK